MTIGRLESHVAAGSAIIGWLVLASGDKQLILFCPVHRRVYSTVCSVLSECLWKNVTGDSGGIRTSRPPSLPDVDWPARIPCSSGFRDYRLLVLASGDKQLILFCPVHRRVYSTVCSVLSECLWKNVTGDSGGIRTHDILLTSADVLTSRPPSLPDDDWPARIPCSSGSAIIGWLVLVASGDKQLILFCPVHRPVYVQCFPSVCEKTSQATRAGFETTTSCLLVQMS